MQPWIINAAAKCRRHEVKKLCQWRRINTRHVHGKTSIRQLLEDNQTSDHVEINGWVRTVRKQKRVAFAAIGDGTTIETIQTVLSPSDAANLSTGTAVKISGSWRSSPGSKQSHELQATGLQILGENDAESNPIQPKYQTRDFLRTVPHLRARIPSNALLLRLRSQLISSITRYFDDQDFIQTHTPIITSSDCEGAGEVFTVSSGSPKSPTSPTSELDAFFRTPKYLTVSAQLHLEALAQAVDKVWTLSPTFRAEKSDTPRHLSEFYMLEAELCFVNDMHEVMNVVENMLRAATTDLTNSTISRELLRARENEATEGDSPAPSSLEQRWAGLLAPNWPRITYDEAIRILHEAQANGTATFSFQPLHSQGFQAEHERYLASAVGQGKPVFVTDYPQAQKPFYMSPSNSSSTSQQSSSKSDTVSCFDLLVPDLCELVGGSMREHRLQPLVDQMSDKGIRAENLDWYKDLRRFGSMPHGGFGLGFDRLLCYLGGVDNIRDVVAFPRWYGRCDC